MNSKKVDRGLYHLHGLYEFKESPYFRYPETPPPLLGRRRFEVLLILRAHDLTVFLGVQIPYMSRTGTDNFRYYTPGGLEVIKLTQQELSLHLKIMISRYDKHSDLYDTTEFPTLEDLEEALDADFEKLERKLKLFCAVLNEITCII